MKALASLNKEQLATLGASALGALLLVLGFAGGAGAGESGPPRGSEMLYGWPGPRYLELPAEKFEQYWKKPIFVTQSFTKLDVPLLRPPEPPEEDLPAPLFRPSPSYDAYNRMNSGAKYPPIVPGTPSLPEAQLPAPAEIDALKKLEEPEAKVRPDKRADRERQHYTVKLKTGTVYEGEFVDDKGDLIMKDAKTGQRLTFKKDLIAPGGILTNRTFQEIYEQDSKKAKGPKEAEERYKLALKCLEWGMVKEAVNELLLALEARNKEFPEASQLLVQLYQELGQLDAALAVAQSAELHYETARILKAFDFAEGALHELEQAVQLNPRHHGAKLGLARALLEAGRAAEATATIDDFFLKLGRSADTTPAHRAEAHAIRGTAHLRQGALERAKQDLDEAVKNDSANAEATNAKGALLALDGQWQAAGAEFEKAIRANQYLTEAWCNLGVLCLLAGKAADAEGLFAAAAQRDPRSADVVAGQALAHYVANKDAKPLLEKALLLDPRHAGANLALGHLKLKAGQDEDALKHFTAALRAEYSFLPAYSGAASAFLRTARKGAADGAADRRVNAETLLRVVKDFDPERPRGWVALGCVYGILGRADEARQALRMALNRYQAANKPVEPLALYALGWVEYHHGPPDDQQRMDLALREFQQAVKLKDPSKDAFSQSVVTAAESACEAIENWQVTILRFNERFDVPDGRTVGPSWLEAEDKYGLTIAVEKGRAKISGRQAIADNGITQLSREFDGDGFHTIEAVFYPEQVQKTEYGLSLYYNQQGESRIGFHVAVDAQGKVRINATASDPRDMDKQDTSRGGWVEVKAPVPNPKEFRIRLTRGEKNRAQNLTLWYWDGAKQDWTVAQKEIPANLGSGRGQWRASVFCRAWMNQDVLLYVDDIRVYSRERR
jgi:tetratricopeptide (TPR) repeat protein